MAELKWTRVVLVGVVSAALGMDFGCSDGPFGFSSDAGATVADSSLAGDGGVDADVDAADPRKEPPVVTPAANIMVDTVAGSATAGSADGIGTAAQFNNPVGVVIDPSTGDLIVSEYDGGRIRKVPVSGASTSTLATGWGEPFALLPTDSGIYIQTDTDAIGDKDTNTGTIWKIPVGGGPGELVVTGLGRPRGLARMLDGRIVVSDRTHNTISVLDPTTKELTLLAGDGTAGWVNGRGTAARFNDPYGIAVLPDGSILVAESFNHVIRKVTLEGDVTTFAGEGVPGMRDDADKMKARFDGPIDVAVDFAGNAFVCDGGNHRIRRISTDGVVETVAGNGTRGFADGVGADAMFYGQEQLDVTPDGKTIYVSDGNGGDRSDHHRIRRITVP